MMISWESSSYKRLLFSPFPNYHLDSHFCDLAHCREPHLGMLFSISTHHSFFLKLINLFIYFWLCWVFVSVHGLSLVAVSGGHSSSWCAGFSLSRPLLLRSRSSRRAGSVIVAHGPSCSAACGILPDQGSNPCPLHGQADSQPLRHQGSPTHHSFNPAHVPSIRILTITASRNGPLICIP